MGDLTPAAPPSVPGYALLRRIGRGSYGEVWLARNDAGEFHAVKVVYRSTFEDDRPFHRELSGIQKFEPVSRTNPSQVSILQVGSNPAEGYFYYAMELADAAEEEPDTPAASDPPASSTPTPPASSPTLAPSPTPIDPLRYIPKTLKLVLQRRGSLTFHECLEIGLALATALDHLHQHGLIHRDIKPSNVIFTEGVPKLADIGLVTDAGESISYVGTEGFLPPEGPGTPRADLYSLGKVLYEMSTGRDRLEFPELPTFTEREGGRDQLLELNQIFLKACQNDSSKRYASAKAMRADLALLQSGRSLRRARQLQRNLAWTQSLALAAVAVAGLTFLALRLSQHRQLERLQEKNDLTNLISSSMTRQLADLAVQNGEKLKTERDAPTALLWFSRALAQEPVNSERRPALEQRLLDTWPLCPIPVLLLTHNGNLSSAHFSGNGNRIITSGEAPSAAVWDASHGQPIGHPMPATGRLEGACLSPDGRSALILNSNGTAQLWAQLEQDPVAFALPHAQPLRQAQFRPDGRQFLGITRAGEILVWETSSRQLHFSIRDELPLREAAFSPDSQTIATLDESGQAKLWDAETGRSLESVTAKFDAPAGLVFSPDSRRLATRVGPTARVWDARSGMVNPHVFSHDGPIHSIAFNLTGDRLATGGEDRTVCVWDLSSGLRVGPPWLHPGPVQVVAYSPDGRLLASAGGRQVQVASATATGVEAHGDGPEVLASFAGRVVALEFSPAGHLLLGASADGTARGFLVNRTHAWLPAPVPRSEDRWAGWAQLLAGQKFAGQQRLIPLSPREQQVLWDQIGAPARAGLAEFEPSDWHRHQAEACEADAAWPAALFHWKSASTFRPQELLFQKGAARAALNAINPPTDHSPATRRRIPERAPEAGPHQLDLSAFYNAALHETWLPTPVVPSGNDLAELPTGLQKLGGVIFDIRGVIQLSGTALETGSGSYPRAVKNIPVHQPCRRLHFLHGASWGALSGVLIASYLIHYADGQSDEARIIYGRHLREWWSPATAAPLTRGAAVAWEGANAASRALGMRLRLYQMTWPNPRPEVEISSIDFLSAQEHPAPFLIAITSE